MKFRTFLQTDRLTDYKKAYLCRLKLLYMNFKSSTLATICTNLLFCLSVISFFGANTTLRLPAVGALYKEYLTGCIALVLFYFQKKILYPKLRHRILSRYIWIYLSLALISAILEILLVYPQVMEILLIDNSKKEAIYCLLYYGFFVFLRDVGILVFSFFFCEYKSQKLLCNTYEIKIRETTNEIPVWVGVENTKGGLIPLPPISSEQHPCTPDDNSFENEPNNASETINTYFGDDLSYLPISDVWYCIQMKNTLFIYSLDNKLYFRSQSLKKIKHILGEHLFFQVSRDTLVMRKYISRVNENVVETENPVTKEKKEFPISDVYRTNELVTWKCETSASDSEQTDIPHRKDGVDSSVGMSIKQHDLLKQKRNKTIYTYISKHPFCKATLLVEKTRIPLSTVNRILAELKKEGLIEYTGSKKTGGYRVVTPAPQAPK